MSQRDGAWRVMLAALCVLSGIAVQTDYAQGFVQEDRPSEEERAWDAFLSPCSTLVTGYFGEQIGDEDEIELNTVRWFVLPFTVTSVLAGTAEEPMEVCVGPFKKDLAAYAARNGVRCLLFLGPSGTPGVDGEFVHSIHFLAPSAPRATAGEQPWEMMEREIAAAIRDENELIASEGMQLAMRYGQFRRLTPPKAACVTACRCSRRSMATPWSSPPSSCSSPRPRCATAPPCPF